MRRSDAQYKAIESPWLENHLQYDWQSVNVKLSEVFLVDSYLPDPTADPSNFCYIWHEIKKQNNIAQALFWGQEGINSQNH